MTEFLVRDSRRPGHFWADNEIVDIYGARIGCYGLLAYMILARHAINGTGEVRKSYRQIGSQAGISQQSVMRGIGALVDCGLIEVIDKGDNVTSATYVLADVKALVDPAYRQLKLASGQRSPQERGVPPASTGVPTASTAFLRGTPLRKKTSSKLKTTSPPKSPSGGLLSVRDRRNLKKRLDELLRQHLDEFGHVRFASDNQTMEPLSSEQALRIACAELFLPIDDARYVLELAGRVS